MDLQSESDLVCFCSAQNCDVMNIIMNCGLAYMVWSRRKTKIMAIIIAVHS